LISARVEAILGLQKIENGAILIQFTFATSILPGEKNGGALRHCNNSQHKAIRDGRFIYGQDEKKERKGSGARAEEDAAAGNDNAG